MKRVFSWDTITLQEFNEINSILAMRLGELDMMLRIMSVIDKVEEHVYLEMPISELVKEMKRLKGVKDEVKPVFSGTGKYTINGKNYILTMPANMTSGQFIDITNTLQSDNPDIAFLCAIALIPEGHTYCDSYSVTELSKEFNDHLFVTQALGISAFFRVVSLELQRVTLLYSRKQMMKALKVETDPVATQKIKESIVRVETILKEIDLNRIGGSV